MPSGDQITAISGLLGMIVGFLFKRERQLASIEAKQDTIDKKLNTIIADVDALALFVGTPRAVANQKIKENKDSGV